jgi:hypothetical protein
MGVCFLVGMNWVWVDEEGRFFVSELVPMGHGYLLGVWTLAPRDTTTSGLVPFCLSTRFECFCSQLRHSRA